MNLNYQEKLSLLHNLLKLTRVDHMESEVEVDFIYRIAERLSITRNEVDDLINKEIKFSVPSEESRRIELFYTFLLVMGIDGHLSGEEVGFCREIGFKLGLNPTATDLLINKMIDKKINKVPADEIISVFKLYHN